MIKRDSSGEVLVFCVAMLPQARRHILVLILWLARSNCKCKLSTTYLIANSFFPRLHHHLEAWLGLHGDCSGKRVLYISLTWSNLNS